MFSNAFIFLFSITPLIKCILFFKILQCIDLGCICSRKYASVTLINLLNELLLGSVGISSLYSVISLEKCILGSKNGLQVFLKYDLSITLETLSLDL